MGALWWEQAKALVEAGEMTRKDVAAKLGVTYDTLRVALSKMGVKGSGKSGPRSSPSWHAMARELIEAGERASVAARRCGVTEKMMQGFVRRHCRPKPDVAPEVVESQRKKLQKPKAPVAGEPNHKIMDAARAYARGEISRDEMMQRIGKKPLPAHVFAQRIL